MKRKDKGSVAMENRDFLPEEVRQLRKMINDHERLMTGMFGDGNGNQGMLWQWNNFLSRQDERQKMVEEERKNAERRDSRRSLLIALGMLVMTCLLAYCAWKESIRQTAQAQPMPSVYSTTPGADYGGDAKDTNHHER